MNLLKKIGITCHGYQPANLVDDQPEDLNPIIIIGFAVLFSALIAGINWGAAGWVFSNSASLHLRLMAALLAALIGIMLVLTFDRSFLYFVDTQPGHGRVKVVLYALVRVILILMVGSITSQAMMPLLLESELMGHALHMVEKHDNKRVETLNDRYDLSGKEKALVQSEQEVERLEKALSVLPIKIQHNLRAAKKCWSTYSAKKRRLIRKGRSKKSARRTLSKLAAKCSRSNKKAKRLHDSYLNPIRSQLSQALGTKQNSETALGEAKKTVRNRVEKAYSIETKAFSPLSSTVLWNLISTNPGALIKWLLITGVLLMLELLPLLLKLQASRSLVGYRIAIDRENRVLKMEEKRQHLKHDIAIGAAVNEVSMATIDKALNTPAVHVEFLKAFTANMSAMAPLESVRAMMREMETRNLDLQEFMQRYPRYATVIAEAWSKAVEQTTEILQRGLQTDSILDISTKEALI